MQPYELIIAIGYNERESEFFFALETLRHFNYNRNGISFPPTYRNDTLCSIIYHFVSIIRKMLRFADTRRFDIELKQLISANAYHLIQNPEKSKYLPKVGSFSETDF